MGARIIRRNIVAHNLFIMLILFFHFCNKIGTVKHQWTFTVSRLYGRIKWTLRISVLICLKNTLSKWTLTLSFLIGRSCYTYIMDMQNGRSIREGYGMIPCTAGPAISFKCRRKRIGLPPVSGISPVPFHAWRMRHRKKRRRIPKEMRRPEAFRGTLGSEDGAELRQKVPGEETVLDALPE